MKHLRSLLGLVGLQLVLGAVYLLVERRRAPEPAFAREALDAAAPPLAVERHGRPASLPEGAHLVHFWATWCTPCVEELPALLAAAEEQGVPLLAVTDEPWPAVEAWFGRPVPPAVVQDPTGEAAAAWQVSGLPDTFVVVDGRLIARMGGPRDWTSREARRYLQELPR